MGSKIGRQGNKTRGYDFTLGLSFVIFSLLAFGTLLTHECHHRAENMVATLGMIRDEYGSVGDYLRKMCTLTDRDVNNIKSRLIGGFNPQL